MEKKYFMFNSIAPSGVANVPPVEVNNCRTLAITVRAKCGSSLDANPKISAFYSKNGMKWDTDNFGSFEITYSAGNYVQKTRIFDCPEEGFIMFKIENQSSADSLSEISVWVSMHTWEKQNA